MWTENETEIKKNIKLTIIRHGKTHLNELHCYVGATDDELSEGGIAEIYEKVKREIYDSYDCIFVSPMKRAVQTADIIFPDEQKIVIDEFREMDFGSFEGKNYDQLKNNIHYRKWIDESRNTEKSEIERLYGNISEEELKEIILPEKQKDFSSRVNEGFYKLIKAIENDATNVCVVAHGGTIMALMSMYTDNDYYSYMLSCGDGITADVTYEMDKNESINISSFCITGRIHT